MTSLLQVRNVAHRFRGLLTGRPFHRAERSPTGLIGPNGAGKARCSTSSRISAAGRRNRLPRKIDHEAFHSGPELRNCMYVSDASSFRPSDGARERDRGLLRKASGIVEPSAFRPAPEFTRAAHLADKTCAEFGLDAVRDQLAGWLPLASSGSSSWPERRRQAQTPVS